MRVRRVARTGARFVRVMQCNASAFARFKANFCIDSSMLPHASPLRSDTGSETFLRHLFRIGNAPVTRILLANGFPDEFSQPAFFISFRVVSRRFALLEHAEIVPAEVLFQHFFPPRKTSRERRKKEKEPIAREVESAFYFGHGTRFSSSLFLLLSTPPPPRFSRGVKKLRNSNIRLTFRATRKHFPYEQTWVFREPKNAARTRFNQHCGTLSAHRVARA